MMLTSASVVEPWPRVSINLDGDVADPDLSRYSKGDLLFGLFGSGVKVGKFKGALIEFACFSWLSTSDVLLEPKLFALFVLFFFFSRVWWGSPYLEPITS
jgi:hypothetical protein